MARDEDEFDSVDASGARWKPTPAQRATLLKEFEENPYPEIETKLRLAQSLDLRHAQISKWFQHRREALVKKGRFSGQKRRDRRTPEELEILESAFAECAYPKTKDVDCLCTRLPDMQPQQVKLWFKHKRMSIARMIRSSSGRGSERSESSKQAANNLSKIARQGGSRANKADSVVSKDLSNKKGKDFNPKETTCAVNEVTKPKRVIQKKRRADGESSASDRQKSGAVRALQRLHSEGGDQVVKEQQAEAVPDALDRPLMVGEPLVPNIPVRQMSKTSSTFNETVDLSPSQAQVLDAFAKLGIPLDDEKLNRLASELGVSVAALQRWWFRNRLPAVGSASVENPIDSRGLQVNSVFDRKMNALNKTSLPANEPFYDPGAQMVPQSGPVIFGSTQDTTHHGNEALRENTEHYFGYASRPSYLRMNPMCEATPVPQMSPGAHLPGREYHRNSTTSWLNQSLQPGFNPGYSPMPMSSGDNMHPQYMGHTMSPCSLKPGLSSSYSSNVYGLQPPMQYSVPMNAGTSGDVSGVQDKWTHSLHASSAPPGSMKPFNSLRTTPNSHHSLAPISYPNDLYR
eukprot:CAMPEP_0182452526 /NCGR_PEP_ID=MMETSP1172-20130603/44293_1 /TAXON_ID=708627 /ORGANISM="Timspurckia oligopyrenoides, Strain CCMP3278" /LENGTH=572 /DNA_ID=CAMNT_0024650363 /DNA_START=217 /DNA_END=1935 /DNA_ORIENTATION=-